ncbi:MAG: imidazole glycerol phosphate synthase, glutamine amidotransferase subunit [Candidatus Schekmanbacteria bacterium RIFCSPHIGHO2_02_FULL_38_11]|uniref:Imidazole glycerol phosphate synthase subunit HisH n=1 Tax=Candidatus Schekmanbacteria bacterium RIFCSPLOWO2_12_FULL_38_15 TaxID=1817883 RepID=A0A1F7SDJ2_9BACT|nr:MAG: imidazole glycerol phosphate synthase, glutamine amidotransferase subunit [Candidatus Schekmanbacteria bacterium RIFCSPHIGHO2_02_FULL_38_11]OGL51490.1 MAG: imidazole glycerol phosphate synthase, glutamine amidotransferase subunit [Candidatus Schekmanbacteria bacterium RIFCSPLOWO2_02_FULL_38_14]OGL51840.1 MAG: imidazole glycerol phosphate synthase, glutamine amidotransferase subunit [Candidatus Schekmanbacteria bacterium RIFCSPLOWO2_12_FULL_38_15]
MIAIVDYGMGNLRSVQKAFEKLKFDALITREQKEIENAKAIVLPGVGAFKDCMDNLENLKLVAPIVDGIKKGKPFLGICLGLQLLFSESEEFGLHRGLDIIKGRVKRFPPDLSDLEGDRGKLKIPHMGWNRIKIIKKAPIYEGIDDESYFYFVHSYYVIPEDKGFAATETSYGINFVSSIWKDNIFATQFHPEKSQKAGLKVLENFGRLVEKS